MGRGGGPRRRRTAASVVVLLTAPSLLGVAALGATEVRGITVSTHTDGREYGGPAMPATYRELRDLGVNWVAIHPYAQIRDDGEVRPWRVTGDPDPLAYVTRAVAQAHEAGLRILVKPHLAYWGTRFGWRGEIEFSEPAQWGRFWEGYEEWIVAVAFASREADAVAVGTELDRTLGFEDEWRRIVARVRAATDAHLTYAANWTDYERVPFWDALDAIGIQAYFPLVDGERPDEEEIREGWRRLGRRLEEDARRLGRSIVLTELGYGRHFRAASEPWSYRDDGGEAAELQATCLRIALETIAETPSVVGAFLWKWFPEPRPAGRNFRLADPANRAVIRGEWGSSASP